MRLPALPRRSPLLWGVSLLLSAALWALLLSGLLGGGLLDGDAGVGLLFAGGWTLTLLPVHSARFRPRAKRPRPRG
ncbi:hypothetical protein [Streptacidiphilus sp. EB129]|uniref:hypothetical protein n=1 Tax=Streptacidiphilus sp. EB129 TaxID=3156262 RepID=UPI00351576B0